MENDVFEGELWHKMWEIKYKRFHSDVKNYPADDVKKFDEFIKSCTAEDVQQYKKELANAWRKLNYDWYFISTIDPTSVLPEPDAFFFSLIEMIEVAEKMDPSEVAYHRKALAWQGLAAYKTNRDDQLKCLEKAVQEISEGVKHGHLYGMLHVKLIDILLDKIKINDQFSHNEFNAIAGYIDRLYLVHWPETLKALAISFRILSFPFPQNRHWHKVFVDKLTAILQAFAQNDPLIYLEWSIELEQIGKAQADYLTPTDVQELAKQSISLLKPLVNYDTDKEAYLRRLGIRFSEAAKQLADQNVVTGALFYYEGALKFFIKELDRNSRVPWVSLERITDVLVSMAVIYLKQGNRYSIIALFEKGKSIFLKQKEQEKDYELNLRWGQFLIEYARLAYGFDAPVILQEAKARLLTALELGKDMYNHEKVLEGLAKIALKSGDRQRSLALLENCINLLYKKPSLLQIYRLVEDETFKEIEHELLAMKNARLSGKNTR